MASETNNPAVAETELSTQKLLLLRRDEQLKARFEVLYKEQRKRLDDVMQQLETEFFITQRTIRGILKGNQQGRKGMTKAERTARIMAVKNRFAVLYSGPMAPMQHYQKVIETLAEEFGASIEWVKGYAPRGKKKATA